MVRGTAYIKNSQLKLERAKMKKDDIAYATANYTAYCLWCKINKLKPFKNCKKRTIITNTVIAYAAESLLAHKLETESFDKANIKCNSMESFLSEDNVASIMTIKL